MDYMIVLYVFVVILFSVLLYKYYKKKYDNNVMEFKKENVDIDVYFFSELYLKKLEYDEMKQNMKAIDLSYKYMKKEEIIQSKMKDYISKYLLLS
jgi:hypothetical protein